MELFTRLAICAVMSLLYLYFLGRHSAILTPENFTDLEVRDQPGTNRWVCVGILNDYQSLNISTSSCLTLDDLPITRDQYGQKGVSLLQRYLQKPGGQDEILTLRGDKAAEFINFADWVRISHSHMSQGLTVYRS